MTLLDHFHPPLHPQHHGESFHSNWATRIADALNDQWLPSEFLAEEFTFGGGRLEIDVATWQDQGLEEGSGAGPAVTTAVRPAWTPPKAPRTVPAVFPDTFAYRPVERAGQPEIDLWLETFEVGGTLPTLPLRLTGDLFVPVDFQTTYHEACRRRRLA